MRTLYSPETIAGFLLQEKIAIHGVSPEVYAQNQGLIHELGRAASASSDALLSVQIIGSRGNGTSDLSSDLDLVAVTFDTETACADRDRLSNAAEGLHVPTDISLAALANGIRDDIPLDATDFVSWADSSVYRTNSLFEEGIFASPDQRLGQLAILSILRTYGREHEVAEQWDEIRLGHSETYLGGIDRMREKLTERLGSSQKAAVRESLSDKLMQQRRARFALPKDGRAYHRQLQSWANKNKQTLQKRQGWQLYQGVLGEL